MKRSILILFCSGLIAALFLMAYSLENNKLTKITDNIILNKDENVLGDIESIDELNGKLLITGWALEKNEIHEYYNWVSGKGEDVYINNKVVLIDEDNNVFGVKTVAVGNGEANEKASDGVDHKKCGVKAAVKLSKLDKNKVYTVGIILININGEELLIKSDKEIKL